MIEVFVGTSGWNYFWNPEGKLEWYLKNTPFNAVELNMSFYRFPFRTLPKRWARVGRGLAWSIKVNQLITHRMRFSEKALSTWKKFRQLFKPMEDKDLIHFYLFQCPPSFRPTQKNVDRLERFIEEVSLGPMFALEFRHESWFVARWERWAKKLGITLVSVDAPDLPRKVFVTSKRIYVRLHGRTAWYSHIYNREELNEILQKIEGEYKNVDSVYFYLNNNHGMLPTGKAIINLVKGRSIFQYRVPKEF